MSKRVYHFNNLGQFIGISEYEGARIPMNSTLLPPPEADPESERPVFDFTSRSWAVLPLLAVELNPEPTVTQITPSIYLVDDFYVDPEAVRQFALSLPYVRYAATFPGLRSPNLASKSIRGKFEAMLGHEIKWGIQSFEESEGSPINECNGVFQLMCASDQAGTYVHADDQMDFAAICYLNPDHQDDPGTGFYTHKATGFSRMPSIEEALPWAMKNYTFPANVKTLLNVAGKDEGSWSLTHHIPMRFNRLVLYDAQLFHRNLTAFGAGLSDGRLTQAFFLSKK